MRRPIWAYLLVFALMALFGGAAYLTRHPDAEVVRRAVGWPWIGPLASRFRQSYETERQAESDAADATRPRETPSDEGPDEDADDATADGDAGEAGRADDQPPRRFDRHVWALGGMELKSRPSPEAPTLYEFRSIARAGRIAREGDWFHVYYHGREGWVLLEGYDEDAEVPYGYAPEPTRPLASRPPDAEWLAAARRYLRGKERLANLGPYALYTDVADDALLAHLGAIAGRLDLAYAERYGRRPLGQPAEAVVIYRSDIAYRLLQRQTERLAGLASAGHNSQGVAVLFIGSRSHADVTATVVHELTHFVNRRAVGPHLPPWLDEGLADDLALAKIDADGRMLPGELGGARSESGGEIRLEGGQAALFRLREAARRGELPKLPGLMRNDWEAFVHTPRIQIHYDSAAFWIRFLLEAEGGRYAPAFRAFLDAVADGGAATAGALGARLGAGWAELDAAFAAWIEQQAAAADLPPPEP